LLRGLPVPQKLAGVHARTSCFAGLQVQYTPIFWLRQVFAQKKKIACIF